MIAQSHANLMWDHAMYLNENYLLQWTVKEPDIMFEVQVRSHGYVGFGFSRDGATIYGADVFIGWIDEGHTFFYVSNLNDVLLSFLEMKRNHDNPSRQKTNYKVDSVRYLSRLCETTQSAYYNPVCT